jgi:hypothetical protein
MPSRLELMGMQAAIPGLREAILELQNKLASYETQCHYAPQIVVHDGPREVESAEIAPTVGETLAIDTSEKKKNGQAAYWAKFTPAEKKAELARRKAKRLRTLRKNGRI